MVSALRSDKPILKLEMAKAILIGYLASMVTQLKYMVMTAFTHLGLGLVQSAEEAIYSGERSTTTTTTNEDSNYVLMWDVSSPISVPVPVVTAFIKKRLPVVLFSDFLEGAELKGMKKQDYDLAVAVAVAHDDDDDEDGEEGKLRCSVCWDSIEGSHQIRELSNCCHVFHGECLDKWVDEGQVTCPLCRSMLLPANTNPWVLCRHAHLSSTTEQQQESRLLPFK